MIRYPKTLLTDQEGNALILTLVVLVALTSVGIISIRTSTTEMNIAFHDKCFKQVYYGTEGNLEMTKELIEQNIEERGFTKKDGSISVPIAWGGYNVYTWNFYMNQPDPVCDNNRVIFSPPNRDVEVPTSGMPTYFRIYGNTQLSSGNALQIAAGYEGRGKGAAGGGGQIVYDIRGLGINIGGGGCQKNAFQLYRHMI